MRQRKAKDLDKRLQECSAYMIEKPQSADSRRGSECLREGKRSGAESSGADAAAHEHDPAMDYFGPDREGRELFLEIGCGKGQFITSKAMDHPEADFIAIEGQETVILRALEKAKELDGDTGRLSNLRFVLTFVHSMDELFYENQLSGIYLNFSDPWPKKGHTKRRLTYRTYLNLYRELLREGGSVVQKTDNPVLFDFSLEEFPACGYTLKNVTRDLHHSIWEEDNVHTEYEDHFASMGMPIHRLEAWL